MEEPPPKVPVEQANYVATAVRTLCAKGWRSGKLCGSADVPPEEALSERGAACSVALGRGGTPFSAYVLVIALGLRVYRASVPRRRGRPPLSPIRHRMRCQAQDVTATASPRRSGRAHDGALEPITRAAHRRRHLSSNTTGALRPPAHRQPRGAREPSTGRASPRRACRRRAGRASSTLFSYSRVRPRSAHCPSPRGPWPPLRTRAG